jgi:uncharacterized membrane protein HdeD (DUF308 family)
MPNETIIVTRSPLAVAREWPAIATIGVLTVVLGGFVIAWPDTTLKVLSVLLGIQLLIFGLYRLVRAFADDTVSKGLSGFVGVLGLIAGVVVVRNPFETVEVLAVILGVLWIVAGAIDLIGSLADDTLPERGWIAFGGVLSIAAGIIVVAWPGPTVLVLAWIAGLYLIVLGLYLIVTSLSLRNLAKES